MSLGRVLLLGGTGTLSSAVLEEAVAKGYDVTIMNRGLSKRVTNTSVKTIICDFYKTAELIESFKDERYDVIVDFLSRRKTDIERIYPFFSKRCYQYVFISSSCVYRRAPEDLPIVESSPKPNINWCYNVDKYECERRLIELSRLENFNYTIVRPYITYDDERIPFGITPPYRYHRTIIERLKNGKPWFTWDEGRAKTTITHTIDFARAVVGLFLNKSAINEDFHVTSDFHCTQAELLEFFFSKLGVSSNYYSFSTELLSSNLPEYRELLIGDRSLDALFDNSKLKAAIPGFEFEIDINKGLDRVISYWEKSDVFEYDYKFEARIDRLFASKSDVRFVSYNNAAKSSKKIYLIYKFLPLRIASKLV